ncbi:hypothetical protein DEA98_25935 [Brucella pseudogrignonensis]|nr:hypothetical protein [Brucella pseudogrignonensis]
MLFALLSPAKASDSMKLSAYLERLNDGAAAQRLAIEVAELIRLNDKASMAKLAEVFEEKDGELLDYVRRFDDSAAHRFALSLQPCQYASISLRMIVMRLLDGGKPHLKAVASCSRARILTRFCRAYVALRNIVRINLFNHNRDEMIDDGRELP